MEHLPELDLSIDDVGHVYPAQIRQDDPVPERSGAPFHPSLELDSDLHLAARPAVH